jgi:Rod binding domain-containing protein
MNIAALANPSAPAVQSPLLDGVEHARAVKLRGSALKMAAPAEQRAAVAAQFEAILVRQMLGKTITSMMGSKDSAAGSVYGDLITETMAQALTAGRGLGIGRMVEQQLTPRGLPAAPAADSAPEKQEHP